MSPVNSSTTTPISIDERGGYLRWGLGNCVEWLAWRCDLSLTTAKEKVRVAHALKTLRLISAAFAEGDAASIDTAANAFARRSVSIRRDPQRGIIVVSMELPLDTGELFEKAVDKARDDEVLNMPDVADTSRSARQADALRNMVTDYSSSSASGTGKDTHRNDNFLVTIHVDQAALQGKQGRSALPIESVKRICCDSHAVVLTETEEGEPLSIGRKSRIVPKGIERAVRARDNNRCRFPGCHHRRFLDCHHVEHWANHGETSVDNLMLLCTQYHTLVHEGGFRIETDFQDNWYFRRPDGIAVPETGYHSRDMLDTDIGSNIDRDTGEVFTSYNKAPAGALLSVLENNKDKENSAKEPPLPAYWH